MRPLKRHYAPILTVVFIAAAVVRMLLLKRSIADLDRFMPDDAYISLTLARSIGLGEGPRFGDYFTNGFQPLFVWLMAIPFALAPVANEVEALDRFVRFAVGLDAVADLGCVLLIAHVLRRHVGAAAALSAAWLWAIHPAVLREAHNGLETSLAVLMLLAIWGWSLRWPFDRAPLSRLFGLGVLVGVGAMARVDIFAVGLFFAAESVVMLSRADRRRGWLRRNIALLAGVCLGYAPWIAYSYAYTGRVFPESGAAVRFITLSQVAHQPDSAFYELSLRMGKEALQRNAGILERWAFWVMALFVLLTLARAMAGQRWRTDGLRVLALPLLFAATIFPAYTLYVLAPWFFPRYLFPCMVPLVGVCAIGVERAVQMVGEQRGVLVLGAAAALAAYTTSAALRDLVAGRNATVGYRPLGLWARKHYPAGTVVGADQAGAIAYYAPSVRIVNLDGVVNEHAARAARSRRLFEYLRAEGIHEVVGWQVNFQCLAANSGGFYINRDMRYAGQIPDMRTWGNPWLLYRPVPLDDLR